jgi:hypothetical protein
MVTWWLVRASWYANELPMRSAPMIAMDSGAIGVVALVAHAKK